MEMEMDHSHSVNENKDASRNAEANVSVEDENKGAESLQESVHIRQTNKLQLATDCPNVTSNTMKSVQAKPPMSEEDAKWHTVGIFEKQLAASVTGYINNNVWSSSGLNLTSEELPDLTNYQRVNLEPGTAYRFRIRAINSCGASPWSDVSSFKTCLPGFPGAPSAIKISKSSEGAHLTWEPPPASINTNDIVEYSVYLAVKPGKEKELKSGSAANTTQPRTPAQLAFVRVYVGAVNQCTVSHTALAAAHVDCSNKPAIIFRIAARNEKGYGPATQVRWLQDPAATSSSSSTQNPSSLLSPTRGRLAENTTAGPSPVKRLKTNSVNRSLLPSNN